MSSELAGAEAGSANRVQLKTLVDPAKVRWIMASKGEPVGLEMLVPRGMMDAPACKDGIEVFLPVSLEAAGEWCTDFWDPYDASQKPVRCFSCGRCLGHRYTPFWIETFERRNKVDTVLDLLGIEPTMYCCKQTLLTYVSIPVKPSAKGEKTVIGGQ
jgi:DNA-directed RNA polymerase subunit N (RpoN/RPB10)